MRGRYIYAILGGLLLLPSLLFSADRNIAMQGIKIELDDITHQLSCQKTELELVHEKLQTIQNSLDRHKEELSESSKAASALGGEKMGSFEKRLATLEKNHKTLIADLQTLKEGINDSLASLAKQETKIADLDQKQTSLKSTLQSMLNLLQGGKGETKSGHLYTVKPGDSLGKIAQDHHVTLKELRASNGLSSDQIVVGQKIKIP